MLRVLDLSGNSFFFFLNTKIDVYFYAFRKLFFVTTPKLFGELLRCFLHTDISIRTMGISLCLTKKKKTKFFAGFRGCLFGRSLKI